VELLESFECQVDGFALNAPQCGKGAVSRESQYTADIQTNLVPDREGCVHVARILFDAFSALPSLALRPRNTYAARIRVLSASEGGTNRTSCEYNHPHIIRLVAVRGHHKDAS
jgi:hypothetical protein